MSKLRSLPLVLWLNVFAMAQYPTMQIKPFHADVSTVIKILGSDYEKKGNDELFFKRKEGNISIIFSEDKCSKTEWGRWNVHPNTVIGWVFYPANKHKKPSFYGLSEKNMKMQVGSGVLNYNDYDSGLYFETYRGRISSVGYSPGSIFDHLKCSDSN